MSDSTSPPDAAVDRWLVAQHNALIHDVATLLDIEAGLRETMLPARHAGLVAELGDVLDVEAGLAAIVPTPADLLGEPNPPSASPDVGAGTNAPTSTFVGIHTLASIIQASRPSVRLHIRAHEALNNLDRALDNQEPRSGPSDVVLSDVGSHFTKGVARAVADVVVVAIALVEAFNRDFGEAVDLVEAFHRDLVEALDRDLTSANDLRRDAARVGDRIRNLTDDLIHIRELVGDLVRDRDLDGAADHVRGLSGALDSALDHVRGLQGNLDYVLMLVDRPRGFVPHFTPALGGGGALALGGLTRALGGLTRAPDRVRDLGRDLVRVRHLVQALDLGQDLLPADASVLANVLDLDPVRDLGRTFDVIRDFVAARTDLDRARHDFAGADLRTVDLTGVPLEALRWSGATQWPIGWEEHIRSRSVEVAPGIFVVSPGTTHTPTPTS